MQRLVIKPPTRKRKLQLLLCSGRARAGAFAYALRRYYSHRRRYYL